jgi:TIR domain
MASFDNDIFISYAHLDNRGGWVDGFQTSLSNWLGVLGVNARIWRDGKLRGDDAFSDEILDQLKRSALLISIVSPNGMKSNWCEKERQRFEQYAEANIGFRIGNAVRAFKVVMTPAEGDAHRPLFDTIGYEFFEKNPQTGRYDHYLPKEHEFEKRIDQLAQDIQAMLETVAAAAAQPARRTIYVAEVSGDLQSDRTKVSDQLTAWGYRVVPALPLPTESPALRDAIEPALAEAALSVHLFSDKRGTIPDNEEKSIPAIQYEMAAEKNLERVVWIPPGTKPHASIDALLQAGAAQRLERIEGGQNIEDLKDILAAKLKGLDERASAAPGEKLNVYVVCDRQDNPFSDDASDRDQALQLKSYLDGRGYCVWFPPGNVSDQSDRDEDHLETLKLSHAVILYWGVAQERWFRGTLRALTKVRTERRDRPFAAEAIYFSRPPVLQKSQYRGHLDLVVDQFDGFQPQALRPVLERLRNARKAAAK